MQHALGHPVSVDLAYNSYIGFNMAYIFITVNSNLSTSLSSLLQELKVQKSVKFWPEGNLSKNVFWLIIPSKCDHIPEETSEIKQIENLYNFLEITTTNDIDNIILDHQITNISDGKTITKEMLLEMLQLEEKARLSKPYIDECTKVKDEVNGWLRISGEIQEKIANKFGFNNPVTNLIAVDNMRRASQIYPNDPQFQEVSVYIRNNLAREGKFEVEDIVPNAVLTNLDNHTTSLHNLVDNQKHNVVIASSET